MAAEAEQKLSDPKTKWIGTDELALRLAGSRIAAARKRAKMTQKELAARLGTTQSEVSRIESRPDATTVKMLRRLARALDVDVHSLFPD